MKRVNTKDLKSSLEREVYRVLNSLKKRFRFKLGYEEEEWDYVLRRKYVPDFIVEKGKKRIYIETKGYLRPEDRAKLLAARDQNPDKDLRILFERNNKISKKSKMHYGDWAEKHGFQYAVGEIPEEWLKE